MEHKFYDKLETLRNEIYSAIVDKVKKNGKYIENPKSKYLYYINNGIILKEISIVNNNLFIVIYDKNIEDNIVINLNYAIKWIMRYYSCYPFLYSLTK